MKTRIDDDFHENTLDTYMESSDYFNKSFTVNARQ